MASTDDWLEYLKPFRKEFSAFHSPSMRCDRLVELLSLNPRCDDPPIGDEDRIRQFSIGSDQI